MNSSTDYLILLTLSRLWHISMLKIKITSSIQTTSEIFFRYGLSSSATLWCVPAFAQLYKILHVTFFMPLGLVYADVFGFIYIFRGGLFTMKRQQCIMVTDDSYLCFTMLTLPSTPISSLSEGVAWTI